MRAPVRDRPLDQPERGPDVPDAVPPVRERVEVDTWVTRTDLGPTSRTFVRGGDFLPHGLVGLPQTPA